jgi:hypothetical protein
MGMVKLKRFVYTGPRVLAALRTRFKERCDEVELAAFDLECGPYVCNKPAGDEFGFRSQQADVDR